MKTSERLLTVAEAAGRLGFKESTIRKRILQRSMVYVKNGRAVRVPIEEVNRLIAKGWREPVGNETDRVLAPDRMH